MDWKKACCALALAGVATLHADTTLQENRKREKNPPKAVPLAVPVVVPVATPVAAPVATPVAAPASVPVAATHVVAPVAAPEPVRAAPVAPSHVEVVVAEPSPPPVEVSAVPLPPPPVSSKWATKPVEPTRALPTLAMMGPGIPFAAQSFRKHPAGEGVALPPVPAELRPLGNQHRAPRKDAAELSQVVVTTLPLGWHSVQRPEEEKARLEQAQITVSPFADWVQRTEDIDAIVKEADRKYKESTAGSKSDGYDLFLGVRYPFTGAQPAPSGGSAVIYSTPAQ